MIDSVQGWIWAVLASGAVSASLLAIAGYLGRTQLTHWLNKDLESVKASHQRELESYRASLIAEVERVKARQDVQKTMAIRMAERKFEAIDRLHRLLEPRAREIVAALMLFQGTGQAERNEQLRKFRVVLQEAAEAASIASAFLTQDESKLMHRYIAKLTASALQLMKDVYSMSPDQLDLTKTELKAMRIECFRILDGHIAKMLSMD